MLKFTNTIFASKIEPIGNFQEGWMLAWPRIAGRLGQSWCQCSQGTVKGWSKLAQRQVTTRTRGSSYLFFFAESWKPIGLSILVFVIHNQILYHVIMNLISWFDWFSLVISDCLDKVRSLSGTIKLLIGSIRSVIARVVNRLPPSITVTN